jgi:hypothetical protein
MDDGSSIDGKQRKRINTYIVQKTTFYIGSMAPSETGYVKIEMHNPNNSNISTTDGKLRGNIDQWTHSTIIIGYNGYFKPMDNGSMIKWPMGGIGIS